GTGAATDGQPILGKLSGRRESVFDLIFGLIFRSAVLRTAGAARFGASLVDDGLDGAGATAAFGAAAEAAIDVLGASRKAGCSSHGIADVMVAQDVAGTDDHETGRPFGDAF